MCEHTEKGSYLINGHYQNKLVDVEVIKSLFGANAVLVPVRADGEVLPGYGPAMKAGAAVPTSILEGSRVAIRLGVENDNLCVLQFYSEAARDEFLAANPTMKNSLQSVSPHGLYLWLRLEDHGCPTNYHSAQFAWLSSGNVTIRKPGGLSSAYKFLNPSCPTTVLLSTLVWKDFDVQEHFALFTMSKKFPPITIDPSGGESLNPRWLAALFLQQRRIAQHHVAKSSPDGQAKEVAGVPAREAVVEFIQQNAPWMQKHNFAITVTPDYLLALVESMMESSGC